MGLRGRVRGTGYGLVARVRDSGWAYRAVLGLVLGFLTLTLTQPWAYRAVGWLDGDLVRIRIRVRVTVGLGLGLGLGLELG